MRITKENLYKVYRQSIIKNNSTEGFFNVFVFRKISILLSWFLASLGISPNVVTTVSFSVNILSGLLLFLDFNTYKIIAIFLLILGHILDMSDGEVARITNRQSKFGAFYDPFLDRIVDIMLPFLFGFGFWFSLSSRDVTLPLIILLYIIARSCIYYLELISYKLDLEQSMEVVRKTRLIRLSSIGKYIKWDGGFTIVLYATTIYFEKLTFLFVFLSIFYGYIVLTSFNKIRYALRNK